MSIVPPITSLGGVDQMKILIVDDHAVVRRGLQQIVLDEYEDIVFGEATNGQEALDALSEQNWDVIVLDISMPGRSGLDVLKEIRKLIDRISRFWFSASIPRISLPSVF